MYLSFILLTLAIVLLWVPGRTRAWFIDYAWLFVYVLAVGAALYYGQMGWVALLPLILFGSICFAFARLAGLWRVWLGLALVVMSLVLGLHVFSGFNNPLIVDQVQLAPDSMAYSLRFNLDKPVVGLFILAWLHPLLHQRTELMTMWRQLLPIAVLTLVAVFLLAWGMGYVRFDFKIPDFLGHWLWANLFFTCVAEEALFRGFIQRQLAIMLSRVRYGAIVALLVTAVLFGMAHALDGVTYVLLTTLAGLGYGWVYQRTQRIEAAILLHFLLNSVHIIFFSYPALLQ